MALNRRMPLDKIFKSLYYRVFYGGWLWENLLIRNQKAGGSNPPIGLPKPGIPKTDLFRRNKNLKNK